MDQSKTGNPVFHHNSGRKMKPRWYKDEFMPTGWYFYDECWSRCYGPFVFESDAKTACGKYAETL
jgi:hypothetical protein